MNKPKLPQEELKEIISQGVKWEIFEAEAAIKLYEEIGKHKDDIFKNDFLSLFDFLQNALLSQIILAITKIYEHEHPKSKYKLRSIPVALNLLKNHSTTLKIGHKEQLEQELTIGGVEECLITKSDQEVTEIVVKQIQEMLLAEDIDGALEGLKNLRDKRIAHSEAIEETDLSQVLWKEIDSLIELVHKVVRIIDTHYLQVPNDIYLESELSYEPEKLRSSLCRLLDNGLTQTIKPTMNNPLPEPSDLADNFMRLHQMYVELDNGVWTAGKNIPLSDEITSLLRKFIERQDYVEPTPEYFDKVRSLIIRKITKY